MSYLFSRALVEASSVENSSDGTASVRSNSTNTPAAYLWSGRTTERCRRSLSGMMCEPLGATNGEAALTWCLEVSRARHSARRREAATTLITCGLKCGESWQMSLLGMCSPKTSARKQSRQPRKTSPKWVTKPSCLPYPRKTWVLTTHGQDTGLVHTPTTKANYSAASMQKWPCSRNFVRAFGKPTPTNHEWLMGWPIGWSDTAPLATDRYQQWFRSHGMPCGVAEGANAEVSEAAGQ